MLTWKLMTINRFTNYILSMLIASTLSASPSYSQSEPITPSSQPVSLFPQKGWFPNPTETIDELFELYELGLKNLENTYGSLQYQDWLKIIDTNKVVFQHESLGKVKYTTIDNVPVFRIIHKKSGTAFLFLDSTQLSKDSQHLQQYLARQHLAKDRNVILMWFQPKIGDREGNLNPPQIRSQIESIDYSPKPETRMNRIREYWRAIYKKPTRDTVLFGVMAATLQSVMGLGVSALKVAADPTANFLIEPAALNMLFGTIIGAYISTYRNWIYETNPSMIAKTLKGSVVSALYAYSLVYMTTDGLSSLSIMDGTAVLLQAKILSNIILNNWGKQEWNQWAEVKSKERVDTKSYLLPIPFSNEPLKIRQRDINYQIYAYLPPQFLRTADLIGITLSLPYLGVPIPIGSIALWTSIPIVKYTTLLWAEKYYANAAKEMGLRQRWEDFKRFPIKLPGYIYQQSLKIIKSTSGMLQDISEKISNSQPIFNKTVTVNEEEMITSQKYWSDFWSNARTEDLQIKSPDTTTTPTEINGNIIRCEAIFNR